MQDAITAITSRYAELAWGPWLLMLLHCVGNPTLVCYVCDSFGELHYLACDVQ